MGVEGHPSEPRSGSGQAGSGPTAVGEGATALRGEGAEAVADSYKGIATDGRRRAWDDHKPPELELIEDCVHCGFCLPTCPTYVLWGE